MRPGPLARPTEDQSVGPVVILLYMCGVSEAVQWVLTPLTLGSLFAWTPLSGSYWWDQKTVSPHRRDVRSGVPIPICCLPGHSCRPDRQVPRGVDEGAPKRWAHFWPKLLCSLSSACDIWFHLRVVPLSPSTTNHWLSAWQLRLFPSRLSFALFLLCATFHSSVSVHNPSCWWGKAVFCLSGLSCSHYTLPHSWGEVLYHSLILLGLCTALQRH